MSEALNRSQQATSIADFLDSASGTFAGKVAFTCGPMSLTYANFHKQGLAFASYLQSIGVGKGDRVALMAPNLPAFPIATLGILKAGAVQVNINPMYTSAELKHQLNDAGVETLVLFSGSSASFVPIKQECSVKRVIVLEVADGTGMDLPSSEADPGIGDTVRFSDALKEGVDLEFHPVDVSRGDLAFLQYTGGTTGPSKGAMLTHGNVLSNISQFYEFLPELSCEGVETVVTAIPMYHIFALTVNFLCYVGCGGRNILITNPRDMASFVSSIKDSRFTMITGVNTLFAGLMLHPDFVNVDFSGLKASVNGGTAALEATSNKWQAITGLPLIQGYGLSETSPVLTIMSPAIRTFTGNVGPALPGTDIKLLDDQDQQVPVGERGELVAKGPQVTSGYYNKPEATAAAFTSDGYFRTGDIAITDEHGNYQIVDRKKDMVIVSGFNVYPNEVEQVAAMCEGVVECACLGVPDEKTGEAVKLFVVKAPGSTVTEAEIIAHCQKSLTPYKVPKQVDFIDEVPKSAVGKMLRRVLREN